jgi:Arm DNA-binding domain/Phage integrase family
MKRTLSDRVVAALRAAADNRPYDVTDATTPGLAVRVMPSRDGKKPSKTFVLIARYGGPRSQPARRRLGRVGQITTDQAREKARAWHALIAQGKDPGQEEERTAAEIERRRANTVAAVVEDYITMETPRMRRGKNISRELRRAILPLWGKRPAADITRSDVQRLIEDIRDRGVVNVVPGIKRGYDRGTPTYARNLLAYLRMVFSWAIERNAYDLESSPVDHVRGERLLGPRRRRDRVLGPDEIFALWRATGRVQYPVGPAYRLLMLSGLRLNETFGAVRTEFDLRNKLWVIPAERMKGRAGAARRHTVPLTERMVEIIQALPTNGTKYLFTRGSRPHCFSDTDKADIDRRMLRTLRALARKRGEDPSGVELPSWVSHDTRRTIRSALGSARVDGRPRFHPDIAEAILAHVRGDETYNRADLTPEKAAALLYWDDFLMRIVEPSPRVVPMMRRIG